MSRYYDDDYDRYDDTDELTEEDIRETYKAIESLTLDYNGEPVFYKSVNKVFYDIFGIKDVGALFSSRSRRYDRARVAVFRKCGIERLVDMFYDIETYKSIQALVKLHYDLNRGKVDKTKADEVANVYMDTIDRIKRMYGIRSRASVSNISNPLKMLRKMNRDYDDDIGIDYDDDDRYYDGYDRGRRRRRRDRDDDYYDDSEFVAKILGDVDSDIVGRKRGRKSPKRRISERGRDRDRDCEYDDDDTDYDTAITDTLSKITDKLDTMNDRISLIERDGYYDEPKREKKPDGISVSLDALNRSIKGIAKAQMETREDVDDIIKVLNHIAADDCEPDDTNVEESPGDMVAGGDLLKSTGGIITDPKQLV
jgi:hypothetical protein